MQHPEFLSTVVSLVPFEINESKPLYPGHFHIPACKNAQPQVLVVEEGIHYVYLSSNDQQLKVRTPSYEIARSVVQDYISAQIGLNSEADASPALFWLPGCLSAADVSVRHANEVKLELERQNRWFENLVVLADDDWEKSRQHKFISDIQRFAARALGQERPWLITARYTEAQGECFACRSAVRKDAIICHNCKAVLNAARIKEVTFANG